MAKLFDDLSDLEIEAYVDGEMAGQKARQMADRLVRRPCRLEKAVRISRLNKELKHSKGILYEDSDLRRLIDMLLRERPAVG